jgi:chromosome segregation ATPase
VAAVNESIPVEQHRSILREKLLELEQNFVRIKREQEARLERERDAAVAAVQQQRQHEYQEALTALKDSNAKLDQAVREEKGNLAEAQRATMEMTRLRDQTQLRVAEMAAAQTTLGGEIKDKQREITELQLTVSKLKQELEGAAKHQLSVEADLRGEHEARQRLQQMVRRAHRLGMHACSL